MDEQLPPRARPPPSPPLFAAPTPPSTRRSAPPPLQSVYRSDVTCPPTLHHPRADNGGEMAIAFCKARACVCVDDNDDAKM